MSTITQYILNRGIPEDIFILLLSIPIILILITFAQRAIGSTTIGIYTPILLVLLWRMIGTKNGIMLFLVIFILMAIVRYFLRKIAVLSMTDPRVLDAMTFCVWIALIILAFLYLPFIKSIPLNNLSLIFILILSLYSRNLMSIWETRGFKRFIAPVIESLILLTSSYFLINWNVIKAAILSYPIGIILISIIIIILLARWRGLKLREYILFKGVLKHVDLP